MKEAVYKKIIKLFICFISIVGCMCMVKDASAASATINITTENKKVAKGDTLYVIITVSSSDLIGGFKGTFSYDSSVLKYVTGGSVMSGNDSEFYLTDTNRENGVNRIKYSIKFIARQKGAVSISLKKPYSIYKADDSSDMSVSYNPLNIMVVGKDEIEKETSETKVNDNKNTSEKNKKEDSKKEDSKKEDSKKEDKKDDENAKSSDKEQESGEAINSDTDIAATYNNNGIVITSSENYTVIETDGSVDAPVGFVKTKISIDGHVVTAYAPDGNSESDYVLIYCRRGNEPPEFYMYDSLQNQFLPYEKVKGWYNEMISEDNGQTDLSSDDSAGIVKFVIICAVILILVLVVFIIYKYLLYKERMQDDYIIENDYDSITSEEDSDSVKKEDNESEIFDNFSGGHTWKRQN